MDYEKLLADRRIKPTAMRLLVLEALTRQRHAVSHRELEEAFGKADRVTLFRTLKTFLGHKIVHTIDDGSGTMKYALCQQSCSCAPDELHTHFHCTTCRKTYCLTDVPVPQVAIPRHFTLQQVNLVLKGLCDHCTAS